MCQRIQSYFQAHLGLMVSAFNTLIDWFGLLPNENGFETFTFRDEDGVSLSGIVRLDTLKEDKRNIADLSVDQIEFSNVLLISKVDLINRDELDNLTAILTNLNREAVIIQMVMGQVPVAQLLNTNRIDFAKAEQAAGWLQKLRDAHIPETNKYGISSYSQLCISV